MKLITNIIERVKLRERRRSSERVKEDFQITERDGEIWLTFAGCPILPSSMLKEDPIATLTRVRELHMKDKY